jgi:hypothetical protein
VSGGLPPRKLPTPLREYAPRLMQIPVIRVLNTLIPLHAVRISGPIRNDGDKFSDPLSHPYKYSLSVPPELGKVTGD